MSTIQHMWLQLSWILKANTAACLFKLAESQYSVPLIEQKTTSPAAVHFLPLSVLWPESARTLEWLFCLYSPAFYSCRRGKVSETTAAFIVHSSSRLWDKPHIFHREAKSGIHLGLYMRTKKNVIMCIPYHLVWAISEVYSKIMK